MTARKGLAIGLLASVLAAGLCYAQPDLAPAPQSTVQNLVGEVCTARPREDLTPEPGLPADAAIRCGESAGGTVTYLRRLQTQQDKPDDRASILAQYAGSRAAQLNATRMSCDPGTWASDGARLYLIPCRLKDGGWPNLVVLAATTVRLSFAEGPPSNIDVLETVGTGAPSARSRTQSLDLLATVWGRPVALAAATDLSRFKDLLRYGRTANALGNFSEAEERFRLALDMQVRLLGAENVAVADTLLELALSTSNSGRADEAAALLRRAEPIIQKSPNDADRARYASYLALEAANRGNFDLGIQNARSASAAWRRLAEAETSTAAFSSGADSEDRTTERGELAMALNLEARMAIRTGDATSANVAATEALLIISKTNGRPQWWRSDVLMTLGEVSSAQGRLSAAETYLNSALVERRRLFGDGPASIAALTALGAAYNAEGMNTSAIVSFREALKVASGMPQRGGVFTAEELVPFVSSIYAFGQTLDDAALKQGLYTEAFGAFETPQSGVVEKTIARAAARQAADDPAMAALIERVQSAERERDRLRLELAHEQSLPDEDRSSTSESNLRDRLDEQTQGTEAARAALTQQFPDYATLANRKPVDLLELRRSLGDKEAVVTFLIGRKASFALLIRRSGLQLGRVSDTSTSIAEAVAELRRGLQAQGGPVPEFDLARSHALYLSLFGDIASGLDGIDHLIVASSGPLASLPLGLLVTSPPRTDDYKGARWLTQRLAISQTPSVGAFHTLRGATPSTVPPRRLLAIGDPSLGTEGVRDRTGALLRLGQTCRQSGPMDRDALIALPPLPETRAEVQRIAQLLGAQADTLLLGGNANEASVRSQPLGDFQVLYFATHGLLPGELRCQGEPGLVLTPPPAAALDRQNDGLLDASEVAQLRLRAALVVLSACNTAGGASGLGGEALGGLAEAFFHAGARSLVVSHWQVPSAAPMDLMTSMFSVLAQNGGASAAKALRAAQMKLISQPSTAHPVFWAAFSLVGDGAITIRTAGAGVNS